MSEVDFSNADLSEILYPYFTDGCVLLRKFASIEGLTKLISAVDELYSEMSETHISPRDLRQRGMPEFHEYFFDEKHNSLLDNVFRSEYKVSDDTATRRIDSVTQSGQWEAPLGPHLDAFIQEFAFTVNFWIPFRDCGVNVPSLGVVRAPFREILSFSGYDGGPEANGPAGEWNFPRFGPAMLTLASTMNPGVVDRLRTLLGDRVWTPTYSLGDAMMLSNWTLHFTHALPEMTERRGNVELRFRSDQTLTEVLDRHTQTLYVQEDDREVALPSRNDRSIAAALEWVRCRTQRFGLR
jgi:hypothetical protein